MNYVSSKLQNANAEERFRAAMALAFINSDPGISVPALCKALSDPERDVRAWAAFALREFANAANSAIPQLEAASKDEDNGVHETVLEALEKIRSYKPQYPREEIVY